VQTLLGDLSNMEWDMSSRTSKGTKRL